MDHDLIALIDLDGSVADYDGAMRRDLKRILKGTKVPPQVEENIGSLIRQTPGWWERLEVLKLGQDIVAALHELAFRLVVLTKGPRRAVNAWTEKVKWVRQNLPTASVTIVEDKGLVYGKVLVDDFPDYISRWLKWRPRGLVLMPAQPWNKGFKHPQVKRIRNTRDLEKVIPLLRRIANGDRNILEPQ